ncbi:MAG: UDP-N-acetylglucosamine 2-epimerase (non-hydrolyzing) [Crocinitomicaceae bacterium]|nr:UDP-N-acetylglucosamine 2-epimerase (non-hydrolyzing) [Crocinitomicaceae bacterium]
MKKIITIIGARPQIIKAAAISRAIKNHFNDVIEELIVHTGQHYDENMSAIFFEELGIPQPHFNLQVGSASHGQQTARIIEGIEKLIIDEKPNGIVIYGDTNSTIAAALAAAKIHLPIFHIEAGLRSFNKSMPEEINRILSDHISTLLFCPTSTAIENLKNEGFSLENNGKATIDNPQTYLCGDIMYDNSLYFSKVSDEKSTILSNESLVDKKFILVTIHRNANTDEADRLNAIFNALMYIQNVTDYIIVLPLHPRTKKMMDSLLSKENREQIDSNAKIKIIPPAGFLDIIALEKNAELIITDSGGLQKEAFFFQKPCVILRPETEWVEIVQNGNALIADADEKRIVEAANCLLVKSDYSYPTLFGDGKAAEFIVSKIIETIS